MRKHLDEYGGALFYNGQYEESREASRAALEIIRKLVLRDRSRYEATYAAYLFNHAVDLTKMGEDDDALAYDAVRHSRSVSNWQERNPSQFESAYARSLGHYANKLHACRTEQRGTSEVAAKQSKSTENL